MVLRGAALAAVTELVAGDPVPAERIGSAIALIWLAVKLREAREALRQVIRERNTYAQLVEAWAFQPATEDYRRPER